MAEERKALAEFTGFSDQVYRHRRNLLALSCLILFCYLNKPDISDISFLGLTAGKGIPVDFFCVVGILYYLAIFTSSARAEYKLRVFNNQNIRSAGFKIEDQTPIERAQQADKMIACYNQNKPYKDEAVQDLIEGLEYYKAHQAPLWKCRQHRLFFDFWIPIILGLLSIMLISYQIYHHNYIFPTQ